MTTTASGQPVNPWSALWAMLIGFFMILVDSTIVAVANPAIMAALKITSYDAIYKQLIGSVPMMDVSSNFAMEEIKLTTALPLTYV